MLHTNPPSMRLSFEHGMVWLQSQTRLTPSKKETSKEGGRGEWRLQGLVQMSNDWLCYQKQLASFLLICSLVSPGLQDYKIKALKPLYVYIVDGSDQHSGRRHCCRLAGRCRCVAQ